MDSRRNFILKEAKVKTPMKVKTPITIDYMTWVSSLHIPITIDYMTWVSSLHDFTSVTSVGVFTSVRENLPFPPCALARHHGVDACLARR